MSTEKSLSIADLLQCAQEELITSVDNAFFEASLLLAYTLTVSRAHLIAWPDKIVGRAKITLYRQLIANRCQGTPIAYLTGVKEFWSLPLSVSTDTLIPRPETEKLVEIALSLIAELASPRVLDLGTGSGAIALAIASERAESTIVATDISTATLKVASSNAVQLGLSQCHFVVTDWCNALTANYFDLVVSNPPYITQFDPHLSQGDLRFEPAMALSSGKNGMDAINIITQNAATHLKTDAWLVVEHGFKQKQRVLDKLQKEGYRNLKSYTDDSGHDRVCIGQK